jgi:hypothetical protein
MPATKAEDFMPVLSENFESGWRFWTDDNTGLTPTYSLSTNQSHSGNYSAWGEYTPNKLFISQDFIATSPDVRVEAWFYLASGGYGVDAGFKLRCNGVVMTNFGVNDYGHPSYEVDKWSGYETNSTIVGSYYNSWTNVTMVLHFSPEDGYIKVWINNSLSFDLSNTNSPYFSIDKITIYSDDGNRGSYIDDISIKQI